MCLLSRFLIWTIFVFWLPRLGWAEPRVLLTEDEQRGGWQSLFDGQTTTGWRNFRKPAIGEGWVVEDGVLTRAQDGAGDIVTKKQFDRFELSLEYRISKGGNSGIMFHVTEAEDAPWKTGPEVQLLDNVDGRDPQKSGWLYQLYHPRRADWLRHAEQQLGLPAPKVADATRPIGNWNHVYLRVAPQQSEIALNGIRYFYFRKATDDWNKRVAASKFSAYPSFGKADRGHICLQDHGDVVSFRNIKIRPLPPDGSVPNPIDGKLPVKRVNAFPNMSWEGFESVDKEGRVRSIRPIVLTHADDGSGRIFVASQSGMIHLLPSHEDGQAKLLLDIRSKVKSWRRSNEEGLLGLTFHPQFKRNGKLFVYYSISDPERSSVISRFRMSSDSSPRIDPASEEVLMTISQPFPNHNGGSMEFGPDGYLYIGLGDGGGFNDTAGHGQNLQTLLGSILRIDVDRRQGDLPYAIPKDNPFVERMDARDEIFAYGFRNVWRLGFDRKTGALWVSDVGQDLWEEIDIVKRGGNYGWSLQEGTHAFGRRVAPTDDLIGPIWEYDHRLGKSITGGYVYRGKRVPVMQGYYLYADYVSGRIWALKYDEQQGTVSENLGVLSGGAPVLAFGEDESGELYYLVESRGGRSIFRFERD